MQIIKEIQFSPFLKGFQFSEKVSDPRVGFQTKSAVFWQHESQEACNIYQQNLNSQKTWELYFL